MSDTTRAGEQDAGQQDAGHPTSGQPGRGRRAVLIGAGAVTVGALATAGLAGCADYGRPVAVTPTPTGPVSLGPTSAIPVGGGKIFADRGVVVTQPVAGQFRCFSAQCTHAGCMVVAVADGTINCPCHGSEFHIADGTVARGPALQALTAEEISIADGTITLT